jgi:uncharacterized protein (TIGR03435 family)
MNLKRDAENNLDRALERLGKPASEDMEAAGERVRQSLRSKGVDLSSEPLDVKPASLWQLRQPYLGAAAAALLVFAVSFSTLRDTGVDARAVVQSPDGSLSRITGDGTQVVRLGERVEPGVILRANDASAAITLADASRIELRPETEFSIERADDGIRIDLRKGGVIVNAAKQPAGHLYVQTKDVTVSVVGTVFLVNAEEEGSRVAVIEGEVRVQQGGTTKNLLSGEQLSSNPQMQLSPVKREVSWSPNAEVHVALLQQSSTPSAPKRLEFETASIRKDEPIGPGFILGGGAPECRGTDGWFGSMEEQAAEKQAAPLGRCIGRHVSLMWLIDVAYGLNARAPSRVIGLENWMRDLWNEGFHLEARAESPATTTKAQLQEMLQSLLADRFKLQVTKEKREVSQMVLIVGPRGPKLQETSQEGAVISSNRVTPAGREIKITGNGSMQAFVTALQPFNIVDRTGIKGTFAFNFSYLIPANPAGAGGGGPRGGGAGQGEPWLNALRDALEDQLGLRLDSVNVPADFIVIEHAERPSEN